MSAVLVRMDKHVDTPAPAVPDGKVVVSRLGSGESRILCSLTSIKLVLEGEEIHEVDGRAHIVRPGQMLIVDRGAEYRAMLRRNVTTMGFCLYLPGPVGEPQPESPLLGRALILSSEASRLGALVRQHGARLHQSLDPDAADPVLQEVRAALNDTLVAAAGNMARIDAKKASTRHEVMNRLEIARAYLHGHLGRSVPLPELAGVAGLSGFHLVRYFSAVYGLPPARYHRKLRLENAARMLTGSHTSATEVADSAGYGDLSAFTHAFTREFGMSPSAYARRSADPRIGGDESA
ncbi:AraC family transcriptional regulator [Sphingomonas gilva]|uniref:AraC family transcriptional regulator n=1 Tax=Sphingomonas gilva TaxID=2305907 RepID=A0A396RXP6_9SPHN|nr:AraC family transcriptional regulator [Sphingomonas gilva]RHW18491.1 AraC family transcriptional regulator [Sphingomonas gilva]